MVRAPYMLALFFVVVFLAPIMIISWYKTVCPVSCVHRSLDFFDCFHKSCDLHQMFQEGRTIWTLVLILGASFGLTAFFPGI